MSLQMGKLHHLFSMSSQPLYPERIQLISPTVSWKGRQRSEVLKPVSGDFPACSQRGQRCQHSRRFIRTRKRG